ADELYCNTCCLVFSLARGKLQEMRL
ncbi:MAG: hypothetical protein QOF41_557, partial [Methylobacteriaceae bacterium]|nr:hypothetical protein [Methylobacteriaceae bacterium]